MKINKDSLAARANNLSKMYSISANVVYSRYFFDCFLTRLSLSPYSKQFVLKGGLYLSSVLGIQNRSTVDIDFIVRNLSIERKLILNVVKEICVFPADDNVIFKYIGDSEIKKDDIYGGLSVTIEGRLENVRQRFDVDIATNDVVYPKDCDYSYNCLLTGENLQLKSYSIVTVIAEKMQTFLLKGVFNSRSKDLYDLYVLNALGKNQNDNLKIAFEKTCANRHFETNKQEAIKVLDLVAANDIQRQRWNAFSRKMKYASNISYDDTIDSIRKLIEMIF